MWLKTNTYTDTHNRTVSTAQNWITLPNMTGKLMYIDMGGTNITFINNFRLQTVVYFSVILVDVN